MSEFIITSDQLERLIEGIEHDTGREISRVVARGTELPEVVRCRDCEYYVKDPDPIDPGWPMMCERTGDDMVEPYGFCAWASKREEDGE